MPKQVSWGEKSGRFWDYWREIPYKSIPDICLQPVLETGYLVLHGGVPPQHSEEAVDDTAAGHFPTSFWKVFSQLDRCHHSGKWIRHLKTFRQGHLISVKRILLKQRWSLLVLYLAKNKQKSYLPYKSYFCVSASVPPNNQKKPKTDTTQTQSDVFSLSPSQGLLPAPLNR